jgi:hypothetical protein
MACSLPYQQILDETGNTLALLRTIIGPRQPELKSAGTFLLRRKVLKHFKEVMHLCRVYSLFYILFSELFCSKSNVVKVDKFLAKFHETFFIVECFINTGIKPFLFKKLFN